MAVNLLVAEPVPKLFRSSRRDPAARSPDQCHQETPTDERPYDASILSCNFA
jgi:hypothetical protein